MNLEAQPKADQTFALFTLLLLGEVSLSIAVILIKASTEHPLLVASYRLFVAAVALIPFFIHDLRRYPGTYGWRQFSWSILPAAALALHFMTWVTGARLTRVANASMIINLTPVIMPFFVWFLFRERVQKLEVWGTILTLAGMMVMTAGNLQVSQSGFRGDLICTGSMLAYAAYIALGRKNGARIPLWLYMVPLYFIAGVICFLCALFFINPIKPYTTENLLYILGLGIIPTVCGHSILNYVLKTFRGQVVSVTNLAQPVISGVIAFMVFGETPSAAFYPAAALIFTGVLVVLRANRYRQG